MLGRTPATHDDAASHCRAQGGGSDGGDSEAAAAGGVIAALELGYQEAKQGAWMARGFVTAFLDAGGAEEVGIRVWGRVRARV